MPILRYEELNHAELMALPRDRTVMLVPNAPLEQHGPHLPLGVDAFTARFFCEKLAERLSAKRADWNFVLFPTFFGGADTLTFTGTIEVPPKVLRAYLLACCEQFAKDGFKTAILVSGHGGPRHMVVLEEIAARMRWRRRMRILPASSKILYDFLRGTYREPLMQKLSASGKPLSTEANQAFEGDLHAGMLETSLMMNIRPELVKPVFSGLRPALLKSTWKLRRSTARKLGEGLGYIGSPAHASPEIGQALSEAILDSTVPLVDRFLGGENVIRHFRTPFYYIPLFRTDFSSVVILLIYLLIVVGGIFYMNRFLVEMFK